MSLKRRMRGGKNSGLKWANVVKILQYCYTGAIGRGLRCCRGARLLSYKEAQTSLIDRWME